ncbi:MAG TPA: Gmad2 immunoglobulin-like domain-containing protein [Segeticoccus sp.]|uniref:Gmad2 immunoglobulin-like domain-containing protein n=1 Tax=Segeticoccus sp. TaxID=2706531 RepID=UPI002D807D33|nr:Gmad2 immunoglobulin-like domain-containing protein [Segeticoccus sp.]HET8599587.1 Gmad2 immunoglobulin-like domain-containing protein [Segeticoccus sp.]
MSGEEQDLERALRRALEREAAGITPHDRLEQIRAAAAATEQERRPRWFTIATAATVAAVLAGGAWGLSQEHRAAPPLPGTSTSRTEHPRLPTGGTHGPDEIPAPTRTGTALPSPFPTGLPVPSTPPGGTAPAPSAGTASVPSTGSATSGPGTAGTRAVTVPVYFVGSTGGADGVGLYRQFLATTAPATPSAADTVRAALDLAVSPRGQVPGTAYLDPWRDVSIAGVTVTGNGIQVSLTGAGRTGSMTGDETRLAVQQLVWTAQAALGRGNLPVTFTVADGSTALFGAYPTDATYTRPSQAFEDLAPLWITAPAPGATLGAGSDVTAQGQACVFEAGVSWELLRASGDVAGAANGNSGDVAGAGNGNSAVVRSGHTTASSACPTRGTWQLDLGTLPSGTWTLRVLATSPADGSVAAETSSTFRVR